MVARMAEAVDAGAALQRSGLHDRLGVSPGEEGAFDRAWPALLAERGHDGEEVQS